MQGEIGYQGEVGGWGGGVVWLVEKKQTGYTRDANIPGTLVTCEMNPLGSYNMYGGGNET